MRLASVLGLLLLSPVVFAQSPATHTSIITVESQGCPVLATARRWAPRTVVETGNSPRNSNGNKLYLHFTPTGERSIVAATVVLHGTTAAAHIEPARNWSAPDLTDTFHLTADPPKGLYDSEVPLHKVPNVRWLDITEVHFADGTVWHESANAHCNVTPNGFLLIDAH